MNNLKKYLELKNIEIKTIKENKTNGNKCFTLEVKKGNDNKTINALSIVKGLSFKTYISNIFHITFNN